MEKEYFAISGMSCAACSARVEKAALGVPGVEHAAVNLLKNSMELGYDGQPATVAAVCAAIELILGFTCNVPVDGVYPLWDYSDMAFNFMGQICLLNTTFFGFMATLMTWLVYPAMEKLFAKIPKDIMNIITVVVIVFFVLVVFMYVINLSLPAGMEI